jgi:hypothetical protein
MTRLAATVIVGVLLMVAGSGGAPASAEGPWVRQFGTRTADEAEAVAVDAVGNAYVAGWTSGALSGQEPAGMLDAFVSSYDPSGTERWTRQFGSAESDLAHGVAVDGAGNVYVVGETRGTLPGQRSAGGRDAFVRSYDGFGNERWTRQFGGGGGDVATGVAVDRDGPGVRGCPPEGSPIVIGMTHSTLPGQTAAGSDDAFIRAYGPDGNEHWTRQYGTDRGEGARTIAVAPDGGLLVAGSTEGAFPGQQWEGGFDAYLRRYDGDGNLQWTRQFGSPADDYAVGLAVDAAGRPTLVGSTDGSLPGQHSAGGTEAFLRQFDAVGAVRWTRQFGSGVADDAWGVAVDRAGTAWVVGTSQRRPGLTETDSPTSDCFLRRYDPAGRELGVSPFGTPGSDIAFSVALDPGPAGGAYVAGSTTGALAGQSASGDRDAYLMLLRP